MTADQIVDAALARCSEFGGKAPSSRTVMYRRLNSRQQQLFARIAELNPDYAGRSAELALAGGAVDCSTLDPQAERITEVTIAAPGTSGHAIGARVHIIPLDDPASALPPRATLRDYRLEGYAGELDAVASVRVYYSRRPNPIQQGTDAADLPEQFQELLIVDLAKHGLRRMLDVPPAVRQEAVALLEAEEGELLEAFDRHIAHFTHAEVSRFGRTGRLTGSTAGD